VLGAHNRTNLQRRSIRWLIGDETWRWPPGHMAEAEARVTAFGWLGKCLFMSQGGEEDDDTHRRFESTDMREWTFACPQCGHRQPFLWENVEWSRDARDETGQWDYRIVRDTAVMLCASCRHAFPDSDRTRRELNLTGAYVVTNPNAPRENAGFHWNALCAMSWGRLAELHLRARAAARAGDLTLMQQFIQKRLALPWREYTEDYRMEIAPGGYRLGETWDGEGGVDASGRVAAPGVPSVCPLRIVTVDCQRDHLYLVVRAWGADGSSRLIWHERTHSFADVAAVRCCCFHLPAICCGLQPMPSGRRISDSRAGVSLLARRGRAASGSAAAWARAASYGTPASKRRNSRLTVLFARPSNLPMAAGPCPCLWRSSSCALSAPVRCA
jgi:hypothetical protein